MDGSSLHLLYEAHTLVARANSTTNSTTSSGDPVRPPAYKAVGLTLAVASGLLIGTSFVLKKTGLLKANAKYNEEAGEGYGYLKNAYWWSGMTLMILGEICNFVAYAFVDAILVTPLGALSVVVTTILSAIFLKERLSFVGKIGCFNCIIGSVVIVMNAPEQSAVADIQEMQHFVIAPGFLSYAGVIILGCAFIAFWVAPRYGKKSMLVYLSICSLIGGLSVVATQGLGSAIVAQAGGKAQFNQWFLYVLLVFVVATLLTEIIYLNKALNLFNAALVTPTYYVFFTSATIVTSAVLFRGFKGTPIGIATVIMGFLQICAGVVLLQLSKSAKDVPDAAVFKGDLDQVREVAEQEQPETEPKADAIRGTAALIRRISQSRAKMEEAEFKRLHEEKMQDHLEPLKENEVVEWDGLRRRKTIIGDGSVPNSPVVRRRTIHPPLGMSHFPDEEEPEERERSHTHGGILESIRHRASSILHPGLADREQVQSPMHPVALTDIEVHPSKVDSPTTLYGSSGLHPEEHVYGLPPSLRKSSRGRKSVPSPLSKPLPDMPEPSMLTPQPQSGARRQFSFSNFLHRGSRTATPVDGSEDIPPPPSRSGLASRGSVFSHEQKKAIKNATEEERLGLVKGDSHRALLDSSPDRSRPLQPIPSHSHSPSDSEIEDDGEEYDGREYGAQYPSASYSRSQPESRGRADVSYSHTRHISDSDGDDGWQMTTPPSDSSHGQRRPVPGPVIGTRDNLPSMQQTQEERRPPSRRRPSPPRNYQPPEIPQFSIPGIGSVGGRPPAPVYLHQRQGSHHRTTSIDQRAGVGQQVQPIPQVPTGSNHSRNLSMNRARHVRMVSSDQVPSQSRERRRPEEQQVVEQEGHEEPPRMRMRRDESPEEIEIGMSSNDLPSTVTSSSTTNENSRKRYEMQSAREREERRKRMSSGWTNQTTQQQQQQGGGAGAGSGSGSGGSTPPTGFI